MLAARLPMATGWGGFLSLFMFWALWVLVSAPIEVGKRAEATRIHFTRLLNDSDVTPKPEERQKPEWTAPDAPPGVPGIEVPTADGPARSVPDRPSITGITGPRTAITSGTDHDAEPVVRVNPQYPPGELRRGVEGWVQVRFSVSKTGMVTDVQVVDANPPNVFDDATINAVRRWRYRPKVVDGVPVERVGLQTVIVFELKE